MAPDSRTLPVRNLPCLSWRAGRKRPTVRKLPDRKTCKQRHRQWRDTTVIQKSCSQELSRKREMGGGCSRNGGVESRAKGGHERPGFSREVPARKSGWPPPRAEKGRWCVSHRPWRAGQVRRMGSVMQAEMSTTPGAEWKGLCYHNPTQISHKAPGLLRSKLTNAQ